MVGLKTLPKNSGTGGCVGNYGILDVKYSTDGLWESESLRLRFGLLFLFPHFQFSIFNSCPLPSGRGCHIRIFYYINRISSLPHAPTHGKYHVVFRIRGNRGVSGGFEKFLILSCVLRRKIL